MPTQTTHSDLITFKVHPADGGVEIPVGILTQSLTILQELIHLFGLQEEGKPLRQRLRLSAEVKEKYLLRFRPPQANCFEITGRVVNGAGSDLHSWEKVERVVGNFHKLYRHAVGGAHKDLVEMIPDSRLRNRLLTRLMDLSPSPGSGYRFELGNGSGTLVSLDETLPGRIETLL